QRPYQRLSSFLKVLLCPDQVPKNITINIHPVRLPSSARRATFSPESPLNENSPANHSVARHVVYVRTRRSQSSHPSRPRWRACFGGGARSRCLVESRAH